MHWLKSILASTANFLRPTGPLASPTPPEPGTIPQNQLALFPVSVEGQWGYIDARGRMVIPPRFAKAAEFSEGLASVTIPDLSDEGVLFEREIGGFIDERGEFVIGPGPPPNWEPPEFHRDYTYHGFHEGLARFHVGDGTGFDGYINRSGILVIEAKFRMAGDFSEGTACVDLPRADGSPFGPSESAFINHEAAYVVAPRPNVTASRFSEGRCVLDHQTDDGEWSVSVIDLHGRTIVRRGVYSGISSFIGGLARVVQDGRVGCIDPTGAVAVPIVFDQLEEFEHCALTTAQKDGRHCLIDRTGRVLFHLPLDPEWTVGPLRCGLAIVRGNRAGYVNEAGELAIPLQFDSNNEFHGGLARVRKDGLEGYINVRGEFIWQTDRWDAPIRNVVAPPLSDLLPPGAEAAPLEYNRQRVKNAIVFAAREPVSVLQPWFESAFGEEFKLDIRNEMPGQVDIDFYRPGLKGSFHARDADEDDAAGFVGFYASRRLKRYLESGPAAVGILILE